MKYLLIPNPKNFSWMTVVTAMGQMFYSLVHRHGYSHYLRFLYEG